jgi:hypothetical protein
MTDPVAKPLVVSTELALASLGSLVAGTPPGIKNAEYYFLVWWAANKHILIEQVTADEKAKEDAAKAEAAKVKAAQDAEAAKVTAAAQAAAVKPPVTLPSAPAAA